MINSKKKVFIGTFDIPRKFLGGPGKFVPEFYNLLYNTNTDNDFEFYGIFNYKIVSNPDDIIYLEKSFFENKKSKLRYTFINFVQKYPYLYFFLRFVKNKVSPKKLLIKQLKHQAHLLHLHDFSSVNFFKYLDIPILFTNHYKGSLYKEYIRYLPNMNRKEYEEFFMQEEIESIKRADLLIFPSYSARELLVEDFPNLKQLIENKSKVIYTGIRDIALSQINKKCFENSNIILNIANHIPDKGIDLALKVFKKLLDVNSKFIFINIGAFGSETKKLEILAEELGIKDKVRFIGVLNHEDVLNYMKKSFMIIHTPVRTVFDLIILEAMSLQVPILASRILGLVEALGENYVFYVNKNGELLFEVDLINDNEIMKEIKNYLRYRFISNFTDSIMIRNYVTLYKSILDDKGIKT